MKFNLFLLLAIIPLILASDDNKQEDIVVDLNDRNFNSHLRKGDWFLKLYICIYIINLISYAPWCGHCKRLAPIYREAAESVKGEINFGEIDATKQRSILLLIIYFQ